MNWVTYGVKDNILYLSNISLKTEAGAKKKLSLMVYYYAGVELEPKDIISFDGGNIFEALDKMELIKSGASEIVVEI